MVRFKNRYILASIEDLQSHEPMNERLLVKIIKENVEIMMGQLFLAKIIYSLQIKYCRFGMAVIRVPRDHCAALVACLFPLRGLRVIKISGTIRNIQKKIYERLRKSLLREPSENEARQIEQIDYS